MVTEISFPVFLRAKGDKRIKRFGSKNDLETHFEPIDIENEEFEGWDNQGFRVLLRLANPKSIKSLEIERLGNRPMRDEALRAFADFAAAEGASFTLPNEPSDLLAIYEVLKGDVQVVWSKKPWFKRVLDRF